MTVQGEDRRLIKDYLPLEVLTRSRRPPVSIRSESCPRWRSRHCRLLQIRFLLQVTPARLRRSNSIFCKDNAKSVPLGGGRGQPDSSAPSARSSHMPVAVASAVIDVS